MERRQFLHWLLGVPVAGSTLLAGCGGSGSGSTGGGLTTTRGVTKLPTGFSMAPTALKVEAGLGGTAIKSDGTFQLTVWSKAAGPTLAWLRSVDKVVLIGFLDSDTNTIDAESSAVALLYFSLGGFMTPPENKKTLLGLIKADPAVPALKATIARRVAANPTALADGDAEIGSALKTATDAILAERPTRMATRAAAKATKPNRASGLDSLLQIDPSGLKSNLEVLQGTPAQSFIATNHARRWCKVFVYETGIQNSSGTKTTYPKVKQLLPSMPLSSTRALGVRTSIFGFFTGNSTFTPVSTDPFTLNLVDGSTQTYFDIVVLGSSSLLTDPAFFSDPKYADEVERWHSELIALNLISWLGDVVFGMLLEIWGVRGLTQSQAAVDAAIANFRNVEIAGWSAILTLAESGKFNEATTAFLAFSAQSAANAVRLRAALAPLLPALGVKVGQDELAAGAQVCLKMFLQALSVADLVLGAVDLGAVLHDLAGSERGELWQATLVKQEVRLSPSSTTVNPGGSTTFSAVVPNSGGRTLRYKWSVVSQFAVLTDTAGGQSGKSFESSSPTVTLATTPSDKSDITVICEVIAVAADNTRTSLGTAQATATIHQDEDPPFGSIIVTLSNPPGGDLDPTLVRQLDPVRAQQVPPTLGATVPIIIEDTHELFAGGGAQNTQLFLSLNFGARIQTGTIALDFNGDQKLSMRLAGPTTGGASVRFIATGGSLQITSVGQSGFPATATIRFKGSASMVAQDDPSLNFHVALDGWITDIALL